jgi:hypothetical protein
MTIADQITRLTNAKAAIKQSIVNKGVTVSDTAKLDEYPALIDSISGEGGGDSNDYYWPDFWEFKFNRAFNAIDYKDARYLFSYTCIVEGEDKYKRLIENLDVSDVDYFDYAFFYFCQAMYNPLNELDLTRWDMSNASSVRYMFNQCGIKHLNISGWSFSSPAMYSLNYFCPNASINTINMSNCNTSKITDFSYCFYSSSGIISIDMTGCDTSKATNMNTMFGGCTKLTTIAGELDASKLTNGLYAGSMSNPFYNCKLIETVYIKNIYKDIPVTNTAKFSINLGTTKVKDECLIYIINELPDLINDKGLTATDKIVLTLTPTNTLTAEQVQVAIDKGWQVANVTSTASTFSLRRRMVYKAVECEMGCYIASDGSRYEIFEAINVMTPQGENVGWDVFSNIEEAAEYYGLTYVEPDEE